MNEQIYRVKNQVRFVKKLNEYTNGWETTGGLYRPEELEELEEVDAISAVTYDSQHATELPINWFDLYALDDNDKRQKIKEIHWDRMEEPSKVYEMEDGTFSEEVTL